MRLVLLCVTLALTSACDSSGPLDTVDSGVDDGIEVQVDRTEYAVGEEVRLSLVNESDRQVVLSMPLACAARLERRSGPSWVAANLPIGCAAVLTPVEAKTTESVVLTLEDVQPGTYRFNVSVLETSQQAYSPSFGVR